MTSALFLGFLALVAGTIVVAAARAFSLRAALTTVAVIGVWFSYVAVLALSGVISNVSLRPPGITFVVLPAFAFVAVFFVRSRIGGRISLAFPIWALIGFETYRVGVELFLHRLASAGLVPNMLTFEGANIDLYIALSAPVIAWISTRGRTGLRVALAWNGLGLLSLANVATRALLTAPGPLHVLHTSVPNVAFGIFPYTFVPGFFAPLAVATHALAIRALRARVRSEIAAPVPRSGDVALLA